MKSTRRTAPPPSQSEFGFSTALKPSPRRGKTKSRRLASPAIDDGADEFAFSSFESMDLADEWDIPSESPLHAPAWTLETRPLLTPDQEREVAGAIRQSKAAFWSHLLQTRVAIEWLASVGAKHSPIEATPTLRASLVKSIAGIRAAFLRFSVTQGSEDKAGFLAALEVVRQPLLSCEFVYARLDDMLSHLRVRFEFLGQIRRRIQAGDPAAVQDLHALEDELWLSETDMGPFFTTLAALEKTFLQHRDRLVLSNLRLAVSQARRFEISGMAPEDLVQESTIALICAAESFEAHKARFSTHATTKIRSSLLRAVDNQNGLVRLPVYVCEQLRKLRKAASLLSARLGREPQPKDLAAHCGLESERVCELLEHERNGRALHMRARPDQTLCLSQVPDAVSGFSASDEERASWAGVQLQAAFSHLTPQQREVVEHRFGLNGAVHGAPQEVAARLRMSAAELRRIESAALAVMGRSLSQAMVFPDEVDAMHGIAA